MAESLRALLNRRRRELHLAWWQIEVALDASRHQINGIDNPGDYPTRTELRQRARAWLARTAKKTQKTAREAAGSER